MPSEKPEVIVIGASSGGIDVLLKLAAGLAADFPVPILVAQHIGSHQSELPNLLTRRGPNRARFGVSGEVPQPGVIYVAPPDHHMLVEHGKIRVWRGPKEQHTRPAINPLFRSAALNYGSRVVGVVLTGTLDDGTAGLKAVKDCGGIAVVQDPQDAREPSMPTSAMTHVDVDHITTAAQLPELLHHLATTPCADVPSGPPRELALEHAASLGETSVQGMYAIGSPSTFTCPDCGGVLFEVAGGKPTRFLCHTGHAYSLRSLAATHEKTVDTALWSSVRALEEKQAVLQRLVQAQAEERPGSESAATQELDELERAIAVLRRYVEEVPGGGGDGS